MKQAKILLTATAVLAVIGGAIAFKARTSGFVIFTHTTLTKPCTIADPNAIYSLTTANVQAKSYSTQLVTTTTTNSCRYVSKVLVSE